MEGGPERREGLLPWRPRKDRGGFGGALGVSVPGRTRAIAAT